MTVTSVRRSDCTAEEAVKQTNQHGWSDQHNKKDSLIEVLGYGCELERISAVVECNHGWSLDHSHIAGGKEGEGHKKLKLLSAIFLDWEGHDLDTVENKYPPQHPFENKEWVYSGANFEIRNGPDSLRPDVGCPQCQSAYIESGNTPAERVLKYLLRIDDGDLFLLPYGNIEAIERMSLYEIELIHISISD